MLLVFLALLSLLRYFLPVVAHGNSWSRDGGYASSTGLFGGDEPVSGHLSPGPLLSRDLARLETLCHRLSSAHQKQVWATCLLLSCLFVLVCILSTYLFIHRDTVYCTCVPVHVCTYVYYMCGYFNRGVK